MPPRVTRMTAGLAVGITLAVAAACGVGAYLYSLRHFDTLVAIARATALSQAELITAALEHEMIEQDRALIARMIESFGREPGVRNVMLLDREGVVRYASAPLPPPQDLRPEGPTCQACHRLPADQRMSSQVIDTFDGAILRTVVPFKNKPECYGCHDPAKKLNGLVIFDLDAGSIREAATRDLRWMVGVSAILTLLLTGVIALIVRVAVLRRLQRFETTAREIAGGQFDRRVPASGSDTISWLAREFNTMADSVTGLLTQVRDERERLETVINSIDDGIVVLDEQRTVIAANAAFLQRTGHERDEVLGCSCTSREPGVCTVADCPSVACLRTGERQVRIVERRAADGTSRWEEVHASPVRAAERGSMCVVEVWRDISDRRAAEARLAESHRLASLGLLASGFSHELSTPLATVLTCVEGLARDLPATSADPAFARLAENAAIARDQILRCRGITQHFLRMSRGQVAAVDVVNVATAVAAVARLISPTAREHHVEIQVHPIAEDVRVRADEAELQHALINLALNAVQACSAGGRVTLAVQAGPPVKIVVSDTGCGIPPEHRSRIFEPFFSLRNGGTGLGLFLSQTFVQRCGGAIRVESAAGVGTSFEITLPGAAHPAAVRAAV